MQSQMRRRRAARSSFARRLIVLVPIMCIFVTYYNMSRFKKQYNNPENTNKVTTTTTTHKQPALSSIGHTTTPAEQKSPSKKNGKLPHYTRTLAPTYTPIETPKTMKELNDANKVEFFRDPENKGDPDTWSPEKFRSEKEALDLTSKLWMDSHQIDDIVLKRLFDEDRRLIDEGINPRNTTPAIDPIKLPPDRHKKYPNKRIGRPKEKVIKSLNESVLEVSEERRATINQQR